MLKLNTLWLIVGGCLLFKSSFANEFNVLPSAHVGYVLLDANTGEKILSQNEDKYFLPASTQKVLTAMAALYALGPEFTYKTSLKADSDKTVAAKIKSDLILEFSGDPSFKVDALDRLFARLSSRGIKEITKDLILDNTAFEKDVYASGWVWDDLSWYFASPIQAMILDENKITLQMKPSDTLGKVASIECVDPHQAQCVTVESHVKTVTFEDSEKRCQLEAHPLRNNKILLSGCWPIDHQVKNLHLAIEDTASYVKALVQRALKKNHINLKGKIRVKKPNNKLEDMLTIVQHESKPLSELLKKVLGESSNLYADAILKTLGPTQSLPASFKGGAKAAKVILEEKTGVNQQSIKMLDGSGLSMYNLATPNAFAQMLWLGMKDQCMRKNLVELLPKPGQNGTLKKRLLYFGNLGKTRFKTGTMQGVSSALGLLEINKKPYVFVIFINDFYGERNQIKTAENQLLQAFSTYLMRRP